MYSDFLTFYQGAYTERVASLTFVTLLSIVPLLMVIIFLTSFFPVFNQSLLLTQAYVAKTFLPEAASIVENYLKNFLHESNQLPILTIIFLFITVWILIATVEQTLNAIWGASNQRSFLYKFALYMSFVIVIPILIGLSLLGTSYLLTSTFLSHYVDTKIINLILHIIPTTINVFLFTFVYTYVPNVRISLKNGLIGGALAAIVLEIVRAGFSLYIKFSDYNILYGAFAAFPIFLIWLYIFWFILLFFAFFIKTLEKGNLVESPACPRL